jgi:hypothetical protein
MAASVSASPISVTTGAPNGTYDATSEWYLMADDFSFPVDSILTHMASPGQDSGTWLIFENNGSAPGAVLGFGTIGPLDADGRFEVTHLLLTGGVTYWYGFYALALDQCPPFDATGSYFSGTDSNGSANAMVATHRRRSCEGGDVLEGWLDAFPSSSFWSREHLPASFTDLSFSAYGQTVPEPVSLVLLTVGAGALLSRRISKQL